MAVGCRAGELMIGLNGQTEDLIQTLGPVCGSLDPSTHRLTGYRLGAAAGPASAGTRKIALCPSGDAVRSIDQTTAFLMNGHAGGFRLSVHCGAFDREGASETFVAELAANITSTTATSAPDWRSTKLTRHGCGPDEFLFSVVINYSTATLSDASVTCHDRASVEDFPFGPKRH